ncbi:hypothetical protein V7165_17460 [Priestia megaterium]|uniref:hypothetical protein n=1 Tax=Priestia megaterium TaxID=1404 RepID=UPI0030096D6D
MVNTNIIEFASMIEEFQEKNQKEFTAFVEDTYSENILQIVLRNHLYFENSLENILKVELKNPSKTLTDRLTFFHKLGLVRALDIIPSELYSVLDYFNKEIRNNFAHDLNFEMKEENIEKLIGPFNRDMKKFYLQCLNDIKLEIPELTKKLISCMYTVWVSIGSYYHQHRMKPIVEEAKLLKKFKKLGKDNPSQIRFIEELEVKLMEKFKEITVG